MSFIRVRIRILIQKNFLYPLDSFMLACLNLSTQLPAICLQHVCMQTDHSMWHVAISFAQFQSADAYTSHFLWLYMHQGHAVGCVRSKNLKKHVAGAKTWQKTKIWTVDRVGVGTH